MSRFAKKAQLAAQVLCRFQIQSVEFAYLSLQRTQRASGGACWWSAPSSA